MTKGQRNTLVFISCWLLIGVISDIFLHRSVEWEETTLPTHLITYTGIIALLLIGAYMLVKNYRTNQSIAKYVLYLGTVTFFIGGFGDTILHEMGISDTTFLSRPTHMLIVLGGALILYAIPAQGDIGYFALPFAGAIYGYILFFVLGNFAIVIVLILLFGFTFSIYQRIRSLPKDIQPVEKREDFQTYR